MLHPASKNFFLSATIMFFISSATGMSAELSATERLQFANGLYGRGIYDLAAAEYRTFVTEYSGHKAVDTARFRLGECYRRTGKSAEAVEQYIHVFENFPKSRFRMKAGLLAGNLALEEGRADKAIEILKQVIKSDPPGQIAASGLYSLGLALRSIERLKEAEKRLEELVKHHPKSDYYPYALLALGRVYSEQDKDKKALQMYARAQKTSDNKDIKAESVFRIAEHHFRNNRFESSSTAYQELIENYPKHRRSGEAGLRAGWAMHNAGSYKRALKYAEKNINRLGDSDDTDAGSLAEWMYILANCLRQLDEYKESLEQYRKLLKRFPSSRFTNEALYEAALASYLLKDYDHSLELARRVDIDKAPAIAEKFYWLLARAYSESGQEEQARKYYKLITVEYPESKLACESAYRLGYRLQEKGECDKASEYYRMIIKKFPSHELAPKAVFSLGVCRAKVDRFEDAIKRWEEFAEKYAGHPLVEEALYRKAMAEIKLERDEKATKDLNEFLEKFSKSERAAVALYWRGVLNQQAGKNEKAEQDLKLALKRGLRGARKLQARFRLAALLKSKQKFEDAADMLQSLLSTEMRKEFAPGILQWLAEYRYSREDYEKSVEAARALVVSSRDEGWKQTGWTLIGRCMLKQDKNQAAASAFKRALAKKVATRFKAESALRLGDIELEEENYEQAGQYYEQAAELAAGDDMLGIRANAYAGIARSWEARDNLEKSSRYFMSVAILYDDPDLAPECLYRAYLNFSKLQKLDSARKAAEELKTKYPQSDYAGKILETDE